MGRLTASVCSLFRLPIVRYAYMRARLHALLIFRGVREVDGHGSIAKTVSDGDGDSTLTVPASSLAGGDFDVFASAGNQDQLHQTATIYSAGNSEPTPQLRTQWRAPSPWHSAAAREGRTSRAPSDSPLPLRCTASTRMNTDT